MRLFELGYFCIIPGETFEARANLDRIAPRWAQGRTYAAGDAVLTHRGWFEAAAAGRVGEAPPEWRRDLPSVADGEITWTPAASTDPSIPVASSVTWTSHISLTPGAPTVEGQELVNTFTLDPTTVPGDTFHLQVDFDFDGQSHTWKARVEAEDPETWL